MEIIELTREKRRFEFALPPTSDEGNFLLRRTLMEHQENLEWQRREEEIKKIQHERLELLKQVLSKRDQENEEKSAQRVEAIRLKKTEQKDCAISKIQRRRIKVLRKMFKSRKLEDNALRKPLREIIEDYANFGSIVYAAITRDGLSLDKKANK